MTNVKQDKVRTVIRRCLLNNKTAQVVIFALFVEQKSLLEVAEELNFTPQQTFTIKSDALNQLQNCKDFVALVEEVMSNYHL